MKPLLDIQNLHIAFDTSCGKLRVVNDISLVIEEGQIFGLVGESGCGKSVTSLAILQLIPKPGHITHGKILFRGDDLLAKSQREMQQVRGGKIAMIFQDPFTSLNPVFKVGRQLLDVIRQHHKIDKKEAKKRVLSTLDSVDLPDVERIFESYPHELSGGQQQRVMIAMALISEPSLIIADEPTTALDVTIQAQILRLLRQLCDERGISILLITHDLGVISEVCDKVTVLYAGAVVETASTDELLANPQHPYTQGLLAAIPQSAQKGQALQAIAGVVPANPGAITGCVFASRCPHVYDRCEHKPSLFTIGENHQSACFLQEEVTHG
ncbi:MAG: ABC transporter ATP-binding protein [Anaerolineae bacterium]|nr:ABC transporter ATP-binding protein [Anaerolineae bacterium]